MLPYGTTAPEALLAAGQAECGISFQDALKFAAAAGAPVVSVMAILQHTAQEIAVLASSAIQRPKDLDGKTYAGFGYPNEEPTLKAVIKDDGGTGTFKTVTLDTAAYDALYAKRADFAITFTAWEGIEATGAGHRPPDVRVRRHGFPDSTRSCSPATRLAGRPSRAGPRVRDGNRPGLCLRRLGSGDGRRTPDRAEPGRLRRQPDPAVESQKSLATKGFLTDASGTVGDQTLTQWQGYSGFLFEQGLLAGPDGKPLTAAPDYGALFTNDYLP